ncbi:hypothetical protein [Micromonospora sp. NPDC049799]|uniref:hypothetical protein n=1 Tax=Micromonospora sp. NPDC049799 TaxID=3154741 RepID=UPI0033ECC0A6
MPRADSGAGNAATKTRCLLIYLGTLLYEATDDLTESDGLADRFLTWARAR